jgi:hypothetical protein
MTHGTAAHLLLGLRMLALVAGWRHRMLVVEVWESQWKPWARATDWWRKADDLDARAMLEWWVERELPRVVSAE